MYQHVSSFIRNTPVTWRRTLANAWSGSQEITQIFWGLNENWDMAQIYIWQTLLGNGNTQRTRPTICNPLLWMTPSCSTRFRDIVIEGRSKLWGGNWGVNSFPCAGSWSPRPWKGSSISAMPSAGSDSGGGVMGGISNSSSPRLGVWNVCWKRTGQGKQC